MPRVYVEDGDINIVGVVRELGWDLSHSMQESTDLIILRGGADINPSIYGAFAHPKTNWWDAKDHKTIALVEHAFGNNIPIVGICRGAQMINAIMGGSMYQHVDNHQKSHHLIDLKTGQEYFVNSIHHQMMIPHKSAEIVAVAKGPVASVLERTTDIGTIIFQVPSNDIPEIEALYYKEFRSLCFQAHPEYAGKNSDTRKYFVELMKRYYPEFFKEEVLVA